MKTGTKIITTVLAMALLAILPAFSSGAGEHGGTAANPVQLTAGYMPILPDSQLFVIAGNHWAKKAGIDLHLVKFSDGPAMVQAVASGKLDVMYFGIGPAMVAKSKGMKIKVVASNIVRQIAFIARSNLAKYYDPANPAATFSAFQKAEGRKAKIATFPKGSVPDTVLRYWLTHQLGVSLSSVQILGMGASRVQEALLAGKVDGASILEPVLTIVQERDPNTKVLARAKEMFPGQPGAVLAVRERVIADHPGTVQKLVDLQIKATKYLRQNVPESSKLVTKFIGAGLVSSATIEKALESPYTHFMADPRKIIGPSQAMLDFQVKSGSIAHSVDLSSLFDTSFYANAGK